MNMKRMLFIITVLAAALSAEAQELTILHLNDTHSHIEPERSGDFKGMGGVLEQAAYIDSVRSAVGSDNVLLLHAGDFSQGSSYFAELGGDIEVDIINAMAFDAVSLGNHEFDNGLAELARRVGNIKVPVLCANYDFKDTPLDGLIRPYVIVKKAGKKIGIIGLLTDLSVLVKSEMVDSLSYRNPAETAEMYACELRKEGCDMVLALTHLGYVGEFYTDFELVANSVGIDLVIGGHSHTFLKEMGIARNRMGRKVPVVTDGKWGLNIGKLTVK